MVTIAWPAFIPFVWTILKKWTEDKCGLSDMESDFLLRVVKRNYIGAHVSNIQINPGYPNNPETQRKTVDEIVKGIYTFFEAVYDDYISFEVALARMGKLYVEKIEYFESIDKTLQIQIHELQYDTCSFSVVKKNNKMLILDDIQQGAKKGKFKMTEAYEDSEASIIVYPIPNFLDGEIKYIFSVLAYKKSFFSNDKLSRKKWDIIMSFFAKMLGIELYYLDSMG